MIACGHPEPEDEGEGYEKLDGTTTALEEWIEEDD